MRKQWQKQVKRRQRLNKRRRKGRNKWLYRKPCNAFFGGSVCHRIYCDRMLNKSLHLKRQGSCSIFRISLVCVCRGQKKWLISTRHKVKRKKADEKVLTCRDRSHISCKNDDVHQSNCWQIIGYFFFLALEPFVCAGERSKRSLPWRQQETVLIRFHLHDMAGLQCQCISFAIFVVIDDIHSMKRSINFLLLGIFFQSEGTQRTNRTASTVDWPLSRWNRIEIIQQGLSQRPLKMIRARRLANS